MSTRELHANKTRATEVDGIRAKAALDMSGAKVSVIGLDPDGRSLSQLVSLHGYQTVGFDADEVKVAQLVTRTAPKAPRNLSIASDEESLRDTDIFIICSPTPLQEDGTPDLTQLKHSCEAVGRSLHEGALVIVGSIVYPGVCEFVALPLIERFSGLGLQRGHESNRDFFFAHAPAAHTPETPRVIGASERESLSRACAFYRSLGEEVVPMRSLKEAESVRVLEDAIRDVDRALVAEFSILFERIGVDMLSVLKALSPSVFEPASLSGIGTPRTSPATYYLTRSGHEHEMGLQFLAGARRIVQHMPDHAVKLLSELMREEHIELKGAKIALLGLSDEYDEEASGENVGEQIRTALERKGATVNVYDPNVSGAGYDLKLALEGAQAAVIAGDHPIFHNMTPRQFEEFGISIVIDARNSLNRDDFERSSILYRGIGRG